MLCYICSECDGHTLCTRHIPPFVVSVDDLMAASGGDEPPAAAAPARSCSPTLGCSRAYDAGPLALQPGQKTHLDQKEQEQEQEQDDEAMAEAEEEQAPLATEVCALPKAARSKARL